MLKQNVTLLIFFFLISFAVQGQTKADFSADITGGCAPIVVKFQNLSSGIDSTTGYSWDLGNGTISTLQNPSAVYSEPGVYRVSLKVTAALGADSIARDAYISVYAKPQVAFFANTRVGCAPATIQFQDSSVSAAGTQNIIWNWDFGDGTIASGQGQSHMYKTPGNYTVNLSVTSDKGCSSSSTVQDYITIAKSVKPQFSNTQQIVCTPPVAIKFTNTTTASETLSYTWDFGNGKTSTKQNPVAVYDAAGSFPVKLIVRGSFGCSDSVTVLNAVNITQINTNFHIPLVCTNAGVVFTDSSSAPAASHLWKFSDGTTDMAPGAAKFFIKPGTYTVTLINNYGTCTDSVTKKLRITTTPTTAFVSSASVSCQAPVTVTFSNNTKSATSYQWDFGDGTVSNKASPVHTYGNAGNYNVTLIAANAGGCSDTVVKPALVVIQSPVVRFKKLPEAGCLPYTTQFFDSVIAADKVISYKWDLGDGFTSTAAAPIHTYNKSGSYPVTLIVKTASGCVESYTLANAITVGTKPRVAFTADKTSVCVLDAIQFKDASSNSTLR